MTSRRAWRSLKFPAVPRGRDLGSGMPTLQQGRQDTLQDFLLPTFSRERILKLKSLFLRTVFFCCGKALMNPSLNSLLTRGWLFLRRSPGLVTVLWLVWVFCCWVVVVVGKGKMLVGSVII